MSPRAPAILSFVLFLALCASVAYWLLLWLAPEPRSVAAPPQAERALPPVTAAANLFGGQPQGSGMANVQLRGIIRAGRAASSVAIIAADGQPTRALRVDAEVLPGVTVAEIQARSVILSDQGVERELSLPAFAAQEGGSAGLQVDSPTSQGSTPPPQPSPPPPQAPPQPAPSAAAASGTSSQGTGASGAGTPAASPGAVPTQPPAGQPTLHPR